MARDVVRMVQQARKQSVLHVADRIRLFLPLSGEWRDAVQGFRDYVSDQTLAKELMLDEAPLSARAREDGLITHTASLGGEEIRFALSRIPD